MTQLEATRSENEPYKTRRSERPGATQIDRFYLLDLLRGLSAFAVLIWHYQHFFYTVPGKVSPDFSVASQPFYSILKPLYTYGWTAVPIFFVLSGFVFFAKYMDAIADRSLGVWNFFVQRFSRLYPLHFVTLLIVAALQWTSWSLDRTFIVYPFNDAYHFLLQVFFMSDWGLQAGPSFNGPIWSVSIGVLLYALFFGVAFWALGRRDARFVTTAVMVCLGGAFMLITDGSLGFIAMGIFCFFAGGVSFLTLDWLIRRKWKAVNIIAVAAPAIVVGAAGLVLKTADGLPAQGKWLVYGLMLPGLVLALAALQLIRAELGKGVRVVGDITYSTYLTHFPIQLTLLLLTKHGVVTLDFSDNSAFLVFLAVVLCVSVPVFYYFEMPMQRLLRRSLQRSARKSVASVVQT